MIYLDHAAATPLDPKVLKVMRPYLKGKFANPSAVYQFATQNRQAIDAARKKVATILNCDPHEIYFTSGGTESNNWAIFSSVTAQIPAGPHIVTSVIEHDSVLKPFEEERFKKTCSRIRSMLADPGRVKERLTSLGNYLAKGRPPKILGHQRRSRDRIFIHERDVLYFHVNLTEVTAHMMNGEELLVGSNLKSILEAVDPTRFQQTHRAYIVNLDQVEKVTPLFAGNFNITLKNSGRTIIPLSRRYAKKLKQFLKW